MAPYYNGLEQVLVDSFKREATTAARPYANDAGVSAVAYLRVKGGRSIAVPYVGEGWISSGDNHPLRQWWDRIVGEGPEAEKNFGRWEFVAIMAFDRRYQPPQVTFNAYSLSPAIIGPLRDFETKIGASMENEQMNTYGDYVGAEGESYPEIAVRAVRGVSQQNPSPVYGYFRAPIEGISHQRVYLFNTLEEARGWFTGLVHAPAQLYDYVAVFAATNLSQPVPGLESFGHTTVSGDAHVGTLWPFLLGLPLGALGGYFYRGWRDGHPGQWIPGIAGAGASNAPYVGCSWGAGASDAPYVGGPWADIASSEPYVGGPWTDLAGPYVGGPWADLAGPYVGGPWADIASNDPYIGGPWLDLTGPHVGGPWVDLVGAGMDVREQRRAWLQTRALIESAKREVIDAQAMTPAAAWVWSFDPSGPLSGTVTELTATQLTPFSSVEQAQAYMFERFHTPHVALALFDTAAVRHWPNPVRWIKSDNPVYEPLIAQRVAQYAPTRTAGDLVGADPRAPSIGSALSNLRDRAQTIANKRAGSVVGVIHTTKDNLWHAVAFRDRDDADDWLNTVTLDQAAYTYAAYYDRDDATWPYPVIEKIGGFRTPKISGAFIGAAIDDTRAYAKSLATAGQGNAAGVVRSVDGTWSSFAFPNLDAAIDWLAGMTAHRRSFTYAGAFEKDLDGTAYVQQEEFGVQAVPSLPAAPIRRALAATSGEHTWWTA